jgi:hypothetical protein
VFTCLHVSSGIFDRIKLLRGLVARLTIFALHLSASHTLRSAELAPEYRRGQLATLWQLAITTGIVLVSILNIWLAEWSEGWRISYGGNIVFAVILVGMLGIMPESPRYLIGKGKNEQAREALAKVRFDDQLDWEMEEIDCEVKEELARGVATWPEIFVTDNQMKYRVLMGMGLQTIQQLSGINAIMVRLLLFSSVLHAIVIVHTSPTFAGHSSMPRRSLKGFLDPKVVSTVLWHSMSSISWPPSSRLPPSNASDV